MFYKKEYIQMLKDIEVRFKSIISTLETNYEPFKRMAEEHKEQRRNRDLVEFTEEEREKFDRLDKLIDRFEELYDMYGRV